MTAPRFSSPRAPIRKPSPTVGARGGLSFAGVRLRFKGKPGLVWPGLAWSGLAWSGLVWSSLVWSGLVWPGLAWPGLAWSGLVWSGLAWSGLADLVWVGQDGKSAYRFNFPFFGALFSPLLRDFLFCFSLRANLLQLFLKKHLTARALKPMLLAVTV